MRMFMAFFLCFCEEPPSTFGACAPVQFLLSHRRLVLLLESVFGRACSSVEVLKCLFFNTFFVVKHLSLFEGKVNEQMLYISLTNNIHKIQEK